MLRNFKYRIYPTKAQGTQLSEQLELCRWMYNKILETRKNAHEQDGATLGLYDTQRMVPIWRKEKPELLKVKAQVLQNVNVRVDLAFKGFFRRVKAGEEKPGYPRFKGYGRYDSMTFPQYGPTGCFRIENDNLVLSKTCTIKIKLHRDLRGKPKTACILRTSTGKWFVTFSCECDPIQLPTELKRIGVDVGLASFATLSNGEKIANPRFFRTDEKNIARAQRRISKSENGTNENKKQRKVLSHILERVTNRRTNFAHQVSRTLIKEYGVIVFENLSVINMVKKNTSHFGHKLNKSIADVAWNQLVQFTAYKAEEAGRLFLQVNPRNTSKKCSRCSSIVEKSLSTRVHDCPYCGLVLDRDHNAAINILALGLQRINTGSPDEVAKAHLCTDGNNHRST